MIILNNHNLYLYPIPITSLPRGDPTQKYNNLVKYAYKTFSFVVCKNRFFVFIVTYSDMIKIFWIRLFQ